MACAKLSLVIQLFKNVPGTQNVPGTHWDPHGISESWRTLRQTLSVQQRVTATFKQRDGRTLHVRKATVAEANLKKLYDALDLPAAPGGVQKLVN